MKYVDDGPALALGVPLDVVLPVLGALLPSSWTDTELNGGGL